MPPREIEFGQDVWRQRPVPDPSLPYAEDAPMGGWGYMDMLGPQTPNPMNERYMDWYLEEAEKQKQMEAMRRMLDEAYGQYPSVQDQPLPAGMPGEQEDPAFYEIINQLAGALGGMPQVYSDIGQDIYEQGPEIKEAAMEMLKRMYPVPQSVGQGLYDYMPPTMNQRALAEIGFPTARATGSVISDIQRGTEPTEMPANALLAGLDPESPEAGTALGLKGIGEHVVNALLDPMMAGAYGAIPKLGIGLGKMLAGKGAPSILGAIAPVAARSGKKLSRRAQRLEEAAIKDKELQKKIFESGEKWADKHYVPEDVGRGGSEVEARFEPDVPAKSVEEFMKEIQHPDDIISPILEQHEKEVLHALRKQYGKQLPKELLGKPRDQFEFLMKETGFENQPTWQEIGLKGGKPPKKGYDIDYLLPTRADVQKAIKELNLKEKGLEDRIIEYLAGAEWTTTPKGVERGKKILKVTDAMDKVMRYLDVQPELVGSKYWKGKGGAKGVPLYVSQMTQRAKKGQQTIGQRAAPEGRPVGRSEEAKKMRKEIAEKEWPKEIGRFLYRSYLPSKEHIKTLGKAMGALGGMGAYSAYEFGRPKHWKDVEPEQFVSPLEASGDLLGMPGRYSEVDQPWYVDMMDALMTHRLTPEEMESKRPSFYELSGQRGYKPEVTTKGKTIVPSEQKTALQMLDIWKALRPLLENEAEMPSPLVGGAKPHKSYYRSLFEPEEAIDWPW